MFDDESSTGVERSDLTSMGETNQCRADASWLKEVAKKNMWLKVVTAPVCQPLMSSLNEASSSTQSS